MKRIIWIVIIIAFGAYFVNDYIEDKKIEKTQRAKEEEFERITKTAIDQLVSKTNAIDNWDEVLSEGKEFSFKKILTIDLEKLWLGDRPILFIGYIDDIATYNDQFYILKVDKGLLSSLHMLGTALSLKLKCDKAKVDSFLKKHPNLISGFGFNSNVAIVAKIENIKTSYYLGDEGKKEEVKIGEGECIDMVFIGDVKL